MVLLLGLLGGCGSPAYEEIAGPDSLYSCADGREVRFLTEEAEGRAVLTTANDRLTLQRATADSGERYVTRTGWEFWVEDDQAQLTSPGRERTTCRAGAIW